MRDLVHRRHAIHQATDAQQLLIMADLRLLAGRRQRDLFVFPSNLFEKLAHFWKRTDLRQVFFLEDRAAIMIGLSTELLQFRLAQEFGQVLVAALPDLFPEFLQRDLFTVMPKG